VAEVSLVRRRKEAYRSREIAQERIERLFQLAAEEQQMHPERSDRYVQLAWKISTRMRVRIPRHLKMLFCKGCRCYLPAWGSRVRLREKVLTITCLRCGRQTRRPYWTREASLEKG
jgi:ribonuclease P protein subunit RPR2